MLIIPPPLIVPKPYILASGGGEDVPGGSATTAFSIGGLDFGAPSPRRKIFAHVGLVDTGSANPTITARSIGGVEAALLQTTHTAANAKFELWEALVPSGSTGAIACTASVGSNYIVASYFAVAGLNTLDAVSSGVGSVADPSAATASGLVPGALVLGLRTTTSVNSTTWTGLAEVFDGGGSHSWTGAAAYSDEGANISISADTGAHTLTMCWVAVR